MIVCSSSVHYVSDLGMVVNYLAWLDPFLQFAPMFQTQLCSLQFFTAVNFTTQHWLMEQTVQISDCNPGIGYSIPGSDIEKFVIPGSRFRIRLANWSLFWYPQLTYFMRRAPTKGISDCREWQWLPKYKFPATARSSTLALINHFIHQTVNILISDI